MCSRCRMRFESERRPFSLAFRLTFFISLTTIAAFFVFTWIMVHSVEKHFGEQDIDDLKQLSTTLVNILGKKNEPENQRLEKLLNAIANHKNIYIYLENDKKNVIYQSTDGPDFKQMIASSIFHDSIDANDIIMWQDLSSRKSSLNT